MRIVQLARRFARRDWGGTETVILEVSKALRARGHDVQIVCTTATDPTPRERIEGIEVTRLPYFYPYLGLGREDRQRLDKKGGSPFSFPLLRHLLALPDLDLLHLHVGNRLGGIGRWVARRRRVPYVITLHGGRFDVPDAEAASWGAPAQGALEWGKVLGLAVGARRVMDDAGAIVCVSPRERALARKRHPGKRVLHLPNGVDAGFFASGDGAGFRRRHGIPEGARVLSCIARIDVQKNQQLLVEALPALLERVPDAHLLLVGNPTGAAYATALRERAARLDLAARVTLVPGLPGASRELVDAYHASDVFALPSIHEPFGIAILEAWSAGLPVVVSRVGGIPALVEEGVDALAFDSDDRDGLVTHAAALLGDPDLRARLASAGRDKARRDYSWQRVTDRLLGLYEELRRERADSGRRG